MPEAIIILSLLGLSVGSFIHVCSERIPIGRSIIAPMSACPSCEMPLRWHELIPLLSFILSRGKCRRCGRPISWSYPLLELVGAIILVGLFFLFGPTPMFLFASVLCLIMLLVAVCDWRYFLIPNPVIAVGVVVGILLTILFFGELLRERILGAAVAAGCVYLVRAGGNVLFRRESMGMGDVKLALLVGLYLGMGGFLFSFWLASLMGLSYVAIVGFHPNSNPKDSRLPFGSFFAVSSCLIFLSQHMLKSLLDPWLTLIQ